MVKDFEYWDKSYSYNSRARRKKTIKIFLE